jgi:formylglycine-generating enzyme required for sulfatase activity
MKKTLILILAALIAGTVSGQDQDGEPDTDVTVSREDPSDSVMHRIGFPPHPAEPEMIFVEGGTFTMGCTGEQGNSCNNDENPAHEVTVSSFHIGKYEMTQAQWKMLMVINPSHFRGDSLPVEKVSRDDVLIFIERLNAITERNYRLPTEAEWEYAARGGNQSKGYRYSGSSIAENVAWTRSNAGGTTHPVGTKQPNELGIYDMSGNVYEWCSDRYGAYRPSPQDNPSGAPTGAERVNRGGSWDFNEGYSRVTLRDFSSSGYSSYDLGFRLVSSAEQPTENDEIP